MTPKCGRIDVKYANCSYHTYVGLGKWTHDPTLEKIIQRISNFTDHLRISITKQANDTTLAWSMSVANRR